MAKCSCCKCHGLCASHVSGVLGGVRPPRVDAALVPVGGAWACPRPRVGRGRMAVLVPGAMQPLPAFSPNSTDGKSSPGSEFPGLELPQLTSCSIHQLPWQQSTQWVEERWRWLLALHCDREGGELGSARLAAWRKLRLLQEEWLLEPPLSVPVIKDRTRSPLCVWNVLPTLPELPGGMVMKATPCPGLNPSSTTY